MVELRKVYFPSTVSMRTSRDGAEQFDFLDRLAQLSDRVPSYSATSIAIGVVALAAVDTIAFKNLAACCGA
jgi:hypothetical protein